MSTVGALIATAFCFLVAAGVLSFAVCLVAVGHGWRPLEEARRRRYRDRCPWGAEVAETLEASSPAVRDATIRLLTVRDSANAAERSLREALAEIEALEASAGEQ